MNIFSTLILFIFISITAFSQQIKIKEIVKETDISIFIENKDTFEIRNGTQIIYPIFISEDQNIARSINNSLKKSLTEFYYLNFDLPTEVILDSVLINGSDGLVNMNYKILFNKNDFFSFTLYFENCGAYCWENEWHYNFDLNNGNEIWPEDFILVDSLEAFKEKIKKRKLKLLDSFLPNILIDSLYNDLDDKNINLIKEKIMECKEKLYFNRFNVMNKGIIFWEGCGWPHNMGINPYYDLFFSYDEIKDYIKAEYHSIFSY